MFPPKLFFALNKAFSGVVFHQRASRLLGIALIIERETTTTGTGVR